MSGQVITLDMLILRTFQWARKSDGGFHPSYGEAGWAIVRERCPGVLPAFKQAPHLGLASRRASSGNYGRCASAGGKVAKTSWQNAAPALFVAVSLRFKATLARLDGQRYGSLPTTGTTGPQSMKTGEILAISGNWLDPFVDHLGKERRSVVAKRGREPGG